MNYLIFSLHGPDARYNVGALRNAYLFPRVYGPGWKMVVYYDPADVVQETVYTLARLPDVLLRALPATSRPHWTKFPGRFWRLLAFEDPLVTRAAGSLVCFRDVDSRPSVREVTATLAWANTPFTFHVMRDFPLHGERVMLSGMMGWRVPRDRTAGKWIVNLADAHLSALYRAGTPLPWASDFFLRDRVWPHIQGDVLVHDAFGPPGIPFPTGLAKGPFVGEQIFVEDGREFPCPKARRLRDESVEARLQTAEKGA